MGYDDKIKFKQQEIYDLICRVLTENEESDGENVEELYETLVDVQNNWEEIITYQFKED